MFAPVLAILFGWAFDLRGIEMGILFLMTATPVAAASYVMAKAMGGNEVMAANIMGITPPSAACFPQAWGLWCCVGWGGCNQSSLHFVDVKCRLLFCLPIYSELNLFCWHNKTPFAQFQILRIPLTKPLTMQRFHTIASRCNHTFHLMIFAF